MPASPFEIDVNAIVELFRKDERTGKNLRSHRYAGFPQPSSSFNVRLKSTAPSDSARRMLVAMHKRPLSHARAIKGNHLFRAGLDEKS